MDSTFDFTAHSHSFSDAAQGGGAAGRAGAKASAGDALTRKTGMSIDEACQILNVTRDAELAEITKVSHKELAVRNGRMAE